MRLPNSAHTSRPWRIHEIVPDFRVEDVWELPTPGGPDDFHRLVTGFVCDDSVAGSSRLADLLIKLRRKIGSLLGLDRPAKGVGGRAGTLRDRLPEDLRDAPTGPQSDGFPLTPVYLLRNEWAAELANRTVHAVMHLSWVSDGSGGYRGRMAILVKPNGPFGAAYMAAIRPFRHLIVYPAMLRGIGRMWATGPEPSAGP
ncbi:DUF2867 domain-containing protein [Streptomyces sp. NPDC052396]|uniref:DUF2867 domain-containing protein n=1 Tax=Streptomyces sp. NPDC052396 TaxID=3365689 RepID=UPI0037D7414C